MLADILSIIVAVSFIAATHPPYRESLKTCFSEFLVLFAKDKSDEILVANYGALVKHHGVDAEETKKFYDENKGNKKFRRKADSIIALERQVAAYETAKKEIVSEET